jgi:hypothetical protein
MEEFRPLSRRSDPTYDEPQEGIPDYLLEPVLNWIASVRGGAGSEKTLRMIQTRLRMFPALDWTRGWQSAWHSLVNRIHDDREFGLDVVDLLLHVSSTGPYRSVLSRELGSGGSAWEVEKLEYGTAQLTRRSPGPITEAMDALRSDSERAHHHLRAAWGYLMGRSPNPSAAYREAVRAVEAAAKPVVLPNDAKATLGKMIRALRDNPGKWDFVLADAGPSEVADMCAMIWTNQSDRHGTDDDSAPMSVSQEEADAAFHIALALVRLFSGRLIRPL